MSSTNVYVNNPHYYDRCECNYISTYQEQSELQPVQTGSSRRITMLLKQNSTLPVDQFQAVLFARKHPSHMSTRRWTGRLLQFVLPWIPTFAALNGTDLADYYDVLLKLFDDSYSSFLCCQIASRRHEHSGEC
jgi:hypothetical protein